MSSSYRRSTDTSDTLSVQTIGTAVVAVLLLAAAVSVAVWRTGGETPDPALAAAETRSLAVSGAPYDFGTISMAAGTVQTTFVVTNTSAAPIRLRQLTTSCMCTRATLRVNATEFGPFGMPGHGPPVPTFEQNLAPGAEAIVVAVFDPAAHGPAGVGRISREVLLTTASGATVRMPFSATVTP